jgi:hypothetical protein
MIIFIAAGGQTGERTSEKMTQVFSRPAGQDLIGLAGLARQASRPADSPDEDARAVARASEGGRV